MSLETMTIDATLSSLLEEGTPDDNWGLTNVLNAGVDGASKELRPVLRFDIPNFSGEIQTAKLSLWLLTAITGSFHLGVYLVDSPQDDLMTAGTGSGNPSPIGVTWNDYEKTYPWSTAGGDVGTDPVSVRWFNSGGPVNQYYDFDLDMENFSFSPGKSYAFILIPSDGTVIAEFDWATHHNALNKPPILAIEVETEVFATPTLVATSKSSTEIDLSWDKTELSDDNFASYLLEQSDTGVGGWTTLTTIVDKDVIIYNHTGLVVQGDVDDFDEDADTYPNGRTKYYRLSVVSNGLGSKTSSVEDATTTPAIRPVSLTFSPKSKYWDNDIIDDNRAYKPYGVQIVPVWYDAADITEDTYIDRLTTENFFRQTSTWPGAASTTDDFSITSLSDEMIVEGDTGYKPYKIKGKIYDTGGLYRIATDDKASEQFDVVWPAPCPIAVPDGVYLTPPPAMVGRPFSAASLIPVDLSIASQQVGSDMYVEGFVGTPTDPGKWGVFSILASAPAYGTGVGGAPTLESTFNITAPGPATMQLFKKVRGQTATSEYNRHISKYSGGYRTRFIFRFDANWDLTGGATYTSLFLDFVRWPFSPLGSTSGYEIEFDSRNTTMVIRRNGNFTTGTQLLANIALAGDAPLQNTNREKFVLVEFITSPYFNTTNEGDVILVVYNIDTTLANVLNIDYDTHPYTYSLTSIGHAVNEQQHYTGDVTSRLTTTKTQVNAEFEYYDISITGKVDDGSYGAKNLTNIQTFGLVDTSIPTFPIKCASDQTSQLCYIEGRIKNSYGAQSRTGEVDDYQGDTINNADPVALLLVQPTGYTNKSVQYNGSFSTDLEGGDLIYEWDPGDGSPTYQTTTFLTNHIYTSVGLYTVKLRVQDEAGLWSDWDEKDIHIFDSDDLFVPITFIAGEPFTSMAPIAEDGDEESPMHGRPVSYYQLGYTGGRKWALTGFTVECSSLPDATLIANAKAEIDELWAYYTNSVLVELTLPVIGVVKGFISKFRPKIDDINARLWTWSMEFSELDETQLGA